jgi:hypothetical protein
VSDIIKGYFIIFAIIAAAMLNYGVSGLAILGIGIGVNIVLVIVWAIFFKK